MNRKTTHARSSLRCWPSAARRGRRFRPLPPYNTDPQNEYVQDQTGRHLELEYGAVHRARDEPVRHGQCRAYVALVDKNKCDTKSAPARAIRPADRRGDRDAQLHHAVVM